MGCSSIYKSKRSFSSPTVLTSISPQNNQKIRKFPGFETIIPLSTQQDSRILQQIIPRKTYSKTNFNVKELNLKQNFKKPYVANNQNFQSPLSKKPSFKEFLEKVDIKSLKRQSSRLQSHKNSILLPTYEGFKDPLAENSSPRSLFTKRKKSIPDIQTHRSNLSTYATGFKKNNLNTELEDFIKKYSQNINLRRISEANVKQKLKENPFFNSPLIKNIKRTENELNLCETVSEDAVEKHKTTKMSPFRKKIQLILSGLVHKKNRKPKIIKEIIKKPSLSNEPKTEVKKELVDPNHKNWDELNIPLNVNREMLEKEVKEEQELLFEYFGTKTKPLTKNIDPKESLLQDLLRKNKLDKNISKQKSIDKTKQEMKINSPTPDISSVKKMVSRKDESPASATTKFIYPTNHKQEVVITIYSENTSKMQKKLLEKMDLDKIFDKKDLKLANGQIKYVKNGRAYVFNLNENVILHKDKIIQIENKSKSEHENETKDDLFNFLVKRNLSPTEYFCSDERKKKHPYVKMSEQKHPYIKKT